MIRQGGLGDLVRHQAATRGDKTYITHRDRAWSFGELDVQTDRTAAAFTSVGVRRGDRVAIMMRNSLEYVATWFGLAKIGAVMVPINTHLKGDGLAHVIQHSGAGHVVLDTDLAEVLAASTQHLEQPLVTIVCGEPPPGTRALAELVAGAPSGYPAARVSADELFAIVYTSGTTGRSKGVMLSHFSYLNTGVEMAEHICPIRPDDILFTNLPLFHVNAQQLTIMGALQAGVPVVLGDHFSASQFWDTIRLARATVFNALGAMMTILFKQPPRPDDADNPVRLVIGAATPANVWRPFEERFGLTITEGYGLTEVGCCCCINPPHDIRRGSIGQPTRWAEMQIGDESGRRLPAGETGEIMVRSKIPHATMEGYYRDPEQTSAAFVDGWFRSGDRGYVDEAGYYYFLDRLKDVIRRRGENISSVEVERVVNTHPSVLESAVVGVPSELGEEEVMAVVVPRPGLAIDPHALVEHCERELAKFMVPRFVRVVAQLPKTPTQRVQKFELRSVGTAGAGTGRSRRTPRHDGGQSTGAGHEVSGEGFDSNE